MQVLFGDPINGASIPGISKDKIYTNCAIGDGICTGLPLITITHFAYAVDFSGAIAFIQKKVNGGGSVSPAPAESGAKGGKGAKDMGGNGAKDMGGKGAKDMGGKGAKDMEGGEQRTWEGREQRRQERREEKDQRIWEERTWEAMIWERK
jgi:hypothetical protein